jgi:hypothetical protein
MVQDAVPHLIRFLESSDAKVRGMAAWTVGLLGAGDPSQNSKHFWEIMLRTGCI